LAAPTNFDTSRLRFGDLIAAGDGLLLIISLFLNWYTVSAKGSVVDFSISGSGWETLGFIDILLFLIGVIAIIIAGLRALGKMPASLPASPGLIVLVLGGLATLLVLYRLIDTPGAGANSDLVDVGRAFGIFVALIAALGVTLGGWMTWNEEGKPKPGGATGGAPGGGASPPLGQGQPYGGTAPQAPAQPQQQAYAQPAATPAAAPAPQAASPAPAAVKADWYPDPRGEKRLRYWDGSAWTDHTAD
jgi:hypothetical protein